MIFHYNLEKYDSNRKENNPYKSKFFLISGTKYNNTAVV